MSSGHPGPDHPREAIALLAEAPAPLLVVVDFDGTLAVGSRDPSAARIEPAAQRALRHLARIATERPDRVATAVLTGRIVEDVAARIRVGGIEYWGDHGLQGAWLPRRGRVASVGRLVASEARFDRHRDSAETLAAGVAGELGSPPWLFVERKGPSVAFHVRQADDVPAARAAVEDAIAAVERREGIVDHGLAHYRGRSVVDLRPVDAGGKREAVERLIDRHRPGAVVVLGDELSDVDAFEAVVAARQPIVGVTVAVQWEGRAVPPELAALADLTLPSARRVGPFLAGLARAIAGA